MIERHPKQHESTGEDCELCGYGDEMCLGRLTDDRFPWPWQCTREKGHAGRHAACGTTLGEHPYIEWDDEDNAGRPGVFGMKGK